MREKLVQDFVSRFAYELQATDKLLFLYRL